MAKIISSFEDLGKDFQLQLINEIVTDHKFGESIIDIIDYASTTKNKTIRTFSGWDGNAAGAGNDGVVALHSSLATGTGTTAVSSISMYCYASGENFLAGSTFALYGIKGA